MGANDFNISVRIDAGVTGSQDVKSFASTISQFFASTVDGNGKVSEAAEKTQAALGKTQAAASAMAKEVANAFKPDIADSLAKGIAKAEARVDSLTRGLTKMYAMKGDGKNTEALRVTIAETEKKLQSANKELARFKELADNLKPPAPSGGGGDSFGMGSLIGSLTLAGLLTKAITTAFGEVKDAVGAVVTEGMRMNEFMETAKLGIATSIQAQYNLVDAQGKMLTGQEAYNAALTMSEEQMKKIRIAGLETAATSEELVKSFQVAVATGASQNITDLNKLRELTVNVSNAATAMGIAQSEVPTALRAVISGRELERTTIGKTLGLTSELIRSWQQQGTLVENLDERLGVYTEGAKRAASSWAVVKSNIKESFQVFSGEVTSGLFEKLRDAAGSILTDVFDTKNLRISDAFSGITDSLKQAFSGTGTVLVDMLTGTIDLAKQLSKWITDNKETLDEWAQGWSEIWVATKAIFGTVVDLVKAIFQVRKDTGEWSFYTSTISVALKVAAYLIAAIADGARTVGGALIWVGGLLLDVILQPIRWWLNEMGNALNLVKKGWGDGLLSVGKAIDGVGAKVRSAGAGMFDAYADGTNAIAKVQKAFESTGKAAEDMGKKTEKAGEKTAKVDSAKHPLKKTAGLGGQNAVAKAEADAAIAMAKAALEQQQRDLDYALSQQLISIKDYYAEKTRIQQENLQKDINAKSTELAKMMGSAPKNANEEQTKQAGIIKLQGELNILRMKEGDIVTENTRKEQDAQKALSDRVLEMRSQLESLTGRQTADTTAAAIEAKYKELGIKLVSEAMASGDWSQVDLINKIVDVEKAKANFTIIQTQYNQAIDAMKLKEQEIQQQETEGTIGPIEAYAQLNALHKDTAATLAQLVPQMEAYARATKDPSMRNSVQRLKLELTETAKAQSELGKSLGSGLTNNLTSFFSDLATAAKSGSDAVKDFGRSVLATFAQIISQQLALMAMKAMFKGTSFGGFLGFAEGGHVRGPGTGTSDSIPAMLSNGEYVIKSSAVERLGVGFLDMVNGVASRPMHGHFAEGGPVSSTVGPAQSVNQSTKIVNVFDPSLVEGMMSTPKGEKAVLNVIGNNPEFIKMLLQ